jgi:hypothetical protein
MTDERIRTPMPDTLKKAWRELAQRKNKPRASQDDAPEDDDDPEMAPEDDDEPAEEIPDFDDDDIPF